jgi:hypothetical protein
VVVMHRESHGSTKTSTGSVNGYDQGGPLIVARGWSLIGGAW